MFPRLAACYAALGPVGPSAMATYITRHTRDWCYLTSEFLEQGAAASEPCRLADLLRGHHLSKRPDQLVFKEQSSRLVDAEGRPMTVWSQGEKNTATVLGPVRADNRRSRQPPQGVRRRWGKLPQPVKSKLCEVTWF